MKKFVVPLVLLLSGITPSFAGDLKDDLVAMEKSAWTAWGKHDGKAFRNLVTEDSVQAVAGAGVTSGRDRIIADISNGSCVVMCFDLSDVKLKQFAIDVAMLTYTASQDTDCDGFQLPAKVYATSIYVRQAGKWRSASYQETPLE